MSDEGVTSRRAFLGALGAGAAAIGAQPVFSIGRAFAQTQAKPAAGAAAAGPVHLNYNENPYGPSPKVIEAIRRAGPMDFGRYYADSYFDELKAKLAEFHKVKPENICIGAGSTEIIKICDDVFLRAHAKLVVAKPAYEAVVQYAANSAAAVNLVPLTPDGRHDLAKMAAATTRETGLVYVCNPNNPTATIVKKDEVARFMGAIPRSVPVLFDEAYAEFVNDAAYESAIKYVREGRNVIVAKTFSKIHGLAGMRVGYAISTPAIISLMKPYTVDFTLTSMAVTAALASLADRANVALVANRNRIEREQFDEQMRRAGYACLESEANFVMVDVKRPVKDLIPEFKERGYLVGRPFDSLPNHLRVTLGTKAEMTGFYPVFNDVMKG
jgi:histidinol-phosphate aminotransferase